MRTSVFREQDRKRALLQQAARVVLRLERVDFPVVDAINVPGLFLAELQAAMDGKGIQVTSLQPP